MNTNHDAHIAPTAFSRPGKVLVVDDDAVTRLFVRAALAGKYRVLETVDGVKALSLLNEISDICCVITDDHMPNMTGHELVEVIRAMPLMRSTPIIMITARDANTVARQVKGHRIGATAFLNKPFTSRQLANMVDFVVGTVVQKQTA